MYHNEFLVRADAHSIVLRHPCLAGSEFTFRVDGTYRYDYQSGGKVQNEHVWKLDHDRKMLMYKNCELHGTMHCDWVKFWHSDDENTRNFYLVLLEWLEVDKILLCTESDTNQS
jgi:hypothetical protein